MLTLDPTTLFFYSRCVSASSGSSNENSFNDAINNWAAAIVNDQPKRKGPTSETSNLPSLTKSATTNSTKRSESSRDSVGIHDDNEVRIGINPYGGFSDDDETFGIERDDAIKSPPKGNKRITSTVTSLYFCFHNN
jgi:hypothetical protein